MDPGADCPIPSSSTEPCMDGLKRLGANMVDDARVWLGTLGTICSAEGLADAMKSFKKSVCGQPRELADTELSSAQPLALLECHCCHGRDRPVDRM